MKAIAYLALIGSLISVVKADHDEVEVKLSGVNPFTRQKAVQFHSISPLDRLLNQKNENDQIQLQLSCQPRNNRASGTKGRQYDFELPLGQINKEVCSNNQVPATQTDECLENDTVVCREDEDYKLELFNLMAQKEQQLALPPSLGSMIVTREMLQCLTDDKLKIHFEYGKRQEFAGAEACFVHTPYITANGHEDNIPFTVLDICNKNDKNQGSKKRCFAFSYQVTIKVFDTAPTPMLQNKIYTKISFTEFNKLVVLPGDQVKTRFTTEYSEQDAVRNMPEIYSPEMPSPIKERYQVIVQGRNTVVLPCDDRKVADALQCKEFVVYCVKPDQMINLTIQGTGNVYKISQRCDSFMEQGGLKWAETQEQLITKKADFDAKYANERNFAIDKVSFTNKYGRTQNEKGWFKFEYSVGSRLHSNEQRCFQGVQLEQVIPTCQFQCKGNDCYLQDPRNPPLPNRRMLVGADGRPDVSEATPSEFNKRFLQKLAGEDVIDATYYQSPDGKFKPGVPLPIPTRHLNPGIYVVPNKMLQMFLNNYISADQTNPERQNFLQSGAVEEVKAANEAAPAIEGNVADGEAEPVQLSASFEHNTGTQYQYNIKDKIKEDGAPPSAIKIEKVPKHGKMMVTEHDGTVRELKVGDIISTRLMENFKYEQGDNACAKDNKEVCDDEFLYTTMSSWIGLGTEFEQQIKLNPVKGKEAVRKTGKIVTESQVAAVAKEIEVVTANENAKAKEQEQTGPISDSHFGEAGCQDYPHMLINLMIGILTVMVSIFIAMMVYIMHLTKQKAVKQEIVKDFDSIAEAKGEEGQKKQELK